MAGHSVDEYLETIYFLAFPIGEYMPLSSGSPTLASRVAEMLGVSRASAGEMLKRLEADGLIERGEQKEALLTASGRARAERVVRKHRIIERLLTDFMGYTAAEAHVHADELGDTFSEEMVERIAVKLGNPDRCPHGWPVRPGLRAGGEPRAGGPRRARGRNACHDRPPRGARRRAPALVLRPGPDARHRDRGESRGAGRRPVLGVDRRRRPRDRREGRRGLVRAPGRLSSAGAPAAPARETGVALYSAGTLSKRSVTRTNPSDLSTKAALVTGLRGRRARFLRVPGTREGRPERPGERSLHSCDGAWHRQKAPYGTGVAAVSMPAAALSASALSVRSHVKSWSSRPKCP